MKNAIVLDSGTRSLKGGLSGDELPRVVIPTVVGHGRREERTDFFVGSAAQKRRSILRLSYPIQYGVVRCWDEMEKLWQHTIEEELLLNSAEHPVLLTEVPLNPTTNREMMCEIMFETFQTPALSVAIQSVLAMYAAARTSGLVLDSGEGVTHSVPVFQGFTLHSSIRRLDVAGCDLTDQLIELLGHKEFNFSSPLYRDIVCDMKENLGYVASIRKLPQSHLTPTIQSEPAKSYTLPDGTPITLTSERHQCTEPLFSPSPESIQFTVSDSIHNLDPGLQTIMSGNIVLAGGTTMFPGFKSRLKHELQPLLTNSPHINIITSNKQKYSSWVGGSILGSLSTFPQLCLTKAEYEEFGRSFVNRRCLMEWDIDPLYGLHSISGG